MNKNEMITKISRTFSRGLLQLKKRSPKILVTAGIAGMVVGAVTACKATTKLSSIMDETKDNIEKINECAEKGYAENGGERVDYSDEDGKNDLRIVYIQTGVKIAKLYAPALIIGILSVTAILASNNILSKRNVALAAAYTAADTGFKEYRKRVREKYGEEAERELRNGIHTKTVSETVVNENGEETIAEKTVTDSEGYSEFARRLSESCEYREETPDYIGMFLRSQQKYANDLLVARGHLFLNEVYDALGYERTPAGQMVGWVYRPDDPDYEGDSYVDFGVDFGNIDNISDIWLDFNVDGVVYDLI